MIDIGWEIGYTYSYTLHDSFFLVSLVFIKEWLTLMLTFSTVYNFVIMFINVYNNFVDKINKDSL